MQTYILRKQLELLEHELEHMKSEHKHEHEHEHDHEEGHEHEHEEEIKELVGRLSLTSLRVSAAYRNEAVRKK